MGSERNSKEEKKKKKSKRKSYSSDSEEEWEMKRQKIEDKEEKKKRKSEGKEKRRDKKSHKRSKDRSLKEKKSKDKHKSEHCKRDGNVRFQEISDSDYFSKNNEFATWLKEEKTVFFSDLSSESARELFSSFVKAWNGQKLSSQYYEGIASGPRTSHNWKIIK